MKVPPSLDELEIELSTGSGVAIIVEGNSYEDDPWFYGQWFGDRAREVTFYPQNGWHQVIAAVTALRERPIGVPVYGIIDRDFCEDHELDMEMLSQKVSGKYVLERLLDMSPGSPNKKHFSLDHYLNLYMESCSTPPADIVNLIERIIKHAGR